MVLGMSNNHKYKVASLFCGGGGLDLGFLGDFKLFSGENSIYLPENPFDIIWANDFFKEAADTYKNNVGNHIHFGDVTKVDFNEVPDVDIVIGGFPCQDFSIAGKMNGFNSERGRLYKRMVELIDVKRPIAFVAENVQNILNKNLVDPDSGLQVLDQILKELKDLGYKTSFKNLYAPDYGIPQKRNRVIIVGIREDIDTEYNFPVPKHPPMNCKQAIDDLWGKETSDDIPNHNQMSLAKFKPPSKVGNQGNYRLIEDEPSFVIRAEHHGNIQGHYRTFNPDNLEDRTAWRRLTVREAARLQTFPDDFIFSGSKTAAYKVVGNAVPPMLGWYIANSLAESLANIKVESESLAKIA